MNTLNLLIVDDEPGIRSGIIRILKNYSVSFPFMEEDINFNLIEAETGEIALDIIKRNKPDIILLDNQLPGIHGIEVLEQINEMKIDSVVMMITSYASLDLAVKATQNGAFNFVPKPFTPQELKTSIDLIAKHLYLKRMTSKMNDESKQIRFQFLSVLSHELKSPINAVEGFLRIMQDKQAGDNIDDYKNMIDRSLVRIAGMRSLIFDLLDLTKMESKTKARNIQKINLSDIANLAIQSVEPLAKQKNIKIYSTINEDISYSADESEIEIIFNNLLSNAVKYNKDGGTVNFNISENNGGISIIVEDTGIGMKQDDVLKLFNDFVRIKNKQTRNITGSGLGLSILKKIVDLNNGKIDIKSEPDKGTTFFITLPN